MIYSWVLHNLENHEMVYDISLWKDNNWKKEHKFHQTIVSKQPCIA